MVKLKIRKKQRLSFLTFIIFLLTTNKVAENGNLYSKPANPKERKEKERNEKERKEKGLSQIVTEKNTKNSLEDKL
jgi:hypothetical protein